MSPQLEAQLEAFFRKRIRLVGGYTIKLAPTEKGIPDRLVIMPGGRMFLVELKTIRGTLSPAQKHWHAKIEAMGGTVVTLAGKDEIVTWIRETIAAGGPRSRRYTTPVIDVG